MSWPPDACAGWTSNKVRWVHASATMGGARRGLHLCLGRVVRERRREERLGWCGYHAHASAHGHPAYTAVVLRVTDPLSRLRTTCCEVLQ